MSGEQRRHRAGDCHWSGCLRTATHRPVLIVPSQGSTDIVGSLRVKLTRVLCKRCTERVPLDELLTEAVRAEIEQAAAKAKRLPPDFDRVRVQWLRLERGER